MRNVRYFSRGLLLGGLAVGALLMFPAAVVQVAVPRPWRLAAMLVLTVLAVAGEIGVLPFRLPQNARQVPSSIIARTDGSGALQFGFEMGTGLRTFLPSHLPYVAAAAVLFLTPWWAAPAVGAGFGVGRIAMVRSAVRSGSANAWHDQFTAWRRTVSVVLWIGAVVCLAAMMRWVVNP